ncbi:alcohol dehydrogenase catalytic domain-containing protein [Novosphingobium sp. BL-52-GroH]|uniref:alcohol dehydrogenase catalytic domain-containing protein n=1 Tax=Novosphingobium sp. BL-52-GroH TaxID=3349877 RepID=UPI00384BFA89
MNPVDWKIREGHMKDMRTFAFPTTLGSELAGTVAALGEGVSDLAPGERVHGSTGALGAFADFAVIARDAVTRIPAQLDFVQAAALPVGVLTSATAFEAAGGIGPDIGC